MKLKQAAIYAQEINDGSLEYIAVDDYNGIHGFEDKPIKGLDGWFPVYGRAWYITRYTGNKKWQKTLRKL